MEDYSKSNSYSMSDDIRALATAFALAKVTFRKTGKGGNNKHMNYKYAQLHEVYNAVEDSLLENDIIIWHYCTVNDKNDEILTTRLIHTKTGQYIQDSRLLVCEKPGNQAKGSANTYMKRYAVLSLCAIGQEDDDCQDEQSYINDNVINQQEVDTIKKMIKAQSDNIALYKQLTKNFKIQSIEHVSKKNYESVLEFIATFNAKE